MNNYETMLAIRELWTFFPHWPLGKVLDNLAIWSCGPECRGVDAVSNQELRMTALAEIEKRRHAGIEQLALTLQQQQGLIAFERFILAHDFAEVGEGAKRFADCLHKRVYDVEDHELMRAAARTQLAGT